MKIDMTLLEKDGAPTIAELKAFFGDHDFTPRNARQPFAAAGRSDLRPSDSGRR